MSAVQERPRKPFKVGNSEKVFKGIVAGSLSELKEKFCLVNRINEPVKVFLEEDLTEVEDEEYFAFLPEQSRILILTESVISRRGVTHTENQLERSESLITRGQDVADGAISSLSQKLMQRMISDPVFFLSISDAELEEVTDADVEEASKELMISKDKMLMHQDHCERELTRRADLQDASELLQLYQRVSQQGRH